MEKDYMEIFLGELNDLCSVLSDNRRIALCYSLLNAVQEFSSPKGVISNIKGFNSPDDVTVFDIPYLAKEELPNRIASVFEDVINRFKFSDDEDLALSFKNLDELFIENMSI